MPRYVVVENTPGYLPDDDDPATFEDEGSAREYLKESVERYCDYLVEGYDFALDYSPRVFWSSDLSCATVEDPMRAHDLGRIFSIAITHEDDLS